MSVSRREARTLSTEAVRVGAKVLGGRLEQDGDSFVINQTNLTALLEQLQGRDIVLIVSAVTADDPSRESKICLTCGHEYTGHECPRCANARSRLRGQR